jgi:hypothetical protein
LIARQGRGQRGEGLDRGGIRIVGQDMQVLGHKEHGERWGAGLALVAVDEQAVVPIDILARRELAKVPERLDPKQRCRRVDEVQVEVVLVLARQVIRANLVTILFTSVRIEADCAGWP